MVDSLKIAIIARPVITVPPVGYGGTERMLYDLTEDLVRLGHKVYLFAKKGSKSSANVISYPEDMKDMKDIKEFVLENLPSDVDVIHDNTEFLVFEKHYYPQRMRNKQVLFTVHYPGKNIYEYPSTVYPSYYIRDRLNGIKDINNVVHHSINLENYDYNENKEDFLLFMGVVSYNKGVHHAIELAKKLDTKLIIAGPREVNLCYDDYFEEYIRPNLNEKIQYIGEVDGEDKKQLFSKAKALIFPTAIETFGLVSIEAMASGTPTLFLDTCTGREIMGEELSQCVCKNVDEMYEVIKNNKLPSSKEVFERVKENFTVRNMSTGYLKCYSDLIKYGHLKSI